MLNQVVLVGRLTNKPKIKTQENGIKNSIITLAVPRNYKNENGIYETDFISVKLYSNIAENTNDYCNTGDMIGIKGRLQTNNKKIELIADKVTFLASSKKQEENEEE